MRPGRSSASSSGSACPPVCGTATSTRTTSTRWPGCRSRASRCKRTCGPSARPTRGRSWLTLGDAYSSQTAVGRFVMAAVALEERKGSGTPEKRLRPLARVAVPFLAGLSGGAAAIHFTVVPEHLADSRRMGIFFLVVAWAQAAWALWIVLRAPTRRVLTAGALLNGAVLAVWVMHHTVGIPFGLAGDHRHPVASIDLTCAVLEALVVAAVVAIFAAGPSRKVPTARFGGLMGVFGIGALIASGFAVLAPGPAEPAAAG